MAENTPRPAGTPEEGQQPPAQPEISLNERDAHTAYSNFARVTATPEEVIIDFALNPNPFAGKQEVNVNHRLIMNFYTAKRLLSALAMTLQRHESIYGQIELDIRRRAQPAPGGMGTAGMGPGQGIIPMK